MRNFTYICKIPPTKQEVFKERQVKIPAAMAPKRENKKKGVKWMTDLKKL